MDDNQDLRRLRLNEFKNTLNYNNIEFAKALKTNPGFISQMLNGHRNITAAFAHKIRKCYPHFNVDWLLSGEGDMFLSDGNVKVIAEIPGLLTGVMEGVSPVYEKGNKIAVDEVGDILFRLASEVVALRGRVEALEKEMDRCRRSRVSEGD